METKIIKNKPVALGYCRVSTDDQIEGISLDYQEEQCRNAAQKDGYNKSEIIIIRDEGRTGTSLHKRKGIQEMIESAKKKEIAIVYVTHSDRFARNVVDHSFLRTTLQSNGVELKYLNGQSSGYDASSIMADNMFATINQYHSDITREKTQQATAAKAKAGYLPTHAPLGYINCPNPDKNCEKVAKKIIIPDPKIAPLITESFKLYATGQYSVYELNDMMYGKGLVTDRNKKVPHSVFGNLLKNRLYLGEIHWIDIHVKDGKHQSLIDEETFNQVQKVMVEKGGNRCRRRKYFWLLTGYAFCPIHNRRYSAEWHLNKSKAYYHCPNRGGCGKYVEHSDLEKQVAEKFKALQFDAGFVASIIKKVKLIFEERRNDYYFKQRGLLNRKNACEAKLKTVEDRLIDETLSKSDYTRIKEEIQTAMAGIDAQITKLSKIKDINIDIASEIISFTKDIYSVYMRSPEPLQKKFIGFFFDGFDIQDGVIIKTRYSLLFEELMRLNVLNYKTSNSRKPLKTTVESEVITGPKLGDYSVMLRI